MGISTGAAILGSGILGAGSSIFGASQAASAQKKAAVAQANANLGMFNTMAGYLAPYRDVGQQYAGELKNRMGDLTAPIGLDQASLEKTPGYQFTLQQGLKSTQNSAAARGLGSSGAALKGAGTYATGLADNTWKDVFNAQTTNAQNTWNRLLQGASLGGNAAAGTGQGALSTGQNIGNALMNAGNAQAGAYTSFGNTGANLANNLGGYYAWQGMNGNNGGGGNSGMYGTDNLGNYLTNTGWASPSQRA